MEHSVNGLLDSLTDAQRAAVTHIDGPLLILAGPGSGKTRVVTHRLAYMLDQGIPPWQLLALTFTNKAADEMKRRLALLAPGRSVWVSTFHRFCGRLLRQYASLVGLEENYSIYDTGDSVSVLKRVIDSMDLDLTHVTPERIQAAISWAKNNLITAEDYQPKPGNPIGNIVAKVYPRYQAELLSSRAVDFDDMLLHVATLLRENPEVRATLDERYRYIMVDEYQDTNLAQYAIVRALSVDYPNLAVTGDPDQSIYGWRGANLTNILEFEKDFPAVNVVRLEQNYRSTKRILHVADHLIQHNTKRKQKGLFTDNEEGKPVAFLAQPNQKTEADWIATYIAGEVAGGRRRPRDFAIFYRMNALSRSLEESLREYSIPFQMINGVEFYQRKEIKDILAYLHLLNNPRDNVAFLRVINTPARGIGKSTIGAIVGHAERTATTLLTAARHAGMIEGLAKRAAVAVARFVAMYDHVQLAATGAVEEIIGLVLSETGYRQSLEESDSEEDEDRLANIEELLTAAREYDEVNPEEGALEGFLEQASLVNDTDAWEVDDDRATLMTLHAAKGLEFPVVFIVAVEDGLLPHERSRDWLDQTEEERRLFFVGITRAQEELYLSLAKYRSFRGQSRLTIPSRFLTELPVSEMDVQDFSWAAPAAWAQGDDVHDAGPADFDHDDERDPERGARSIAAATNGVRLMTAAQLGVAAAGIRREGEPASREGEAPAEPAIRGGEAPAGREQGRMAEPATLPAVDPDIFHHGMVVRHPRYGLGKILALSGNGVKRTATVAFAEGHGEKRFILTHSPLRPASAVGR